MARLGLGRTRLRDTLGSPLGHALGLGRTLLNLLGLSVLGLDEHFLGIRLAILYGTS